MYVCVYVCVNTDIPPTFLCSLPKTWFSSATVQWSTIAMHTCSQSVKVTQQGLAQHIHMNGPTKVQTHMSLHNYLVHLVPNKHLPLKYSPALYFLIYATPQHSNIVFVLETYSTHKTAYNSAKHGNLSHPFTELMCCFMFLCFYY